MSPGLRGEFPQTTPYPGWLTALALSSQNEQTLIMAPCSSLHLYLIKPTVHLRKEAGEREPPLSS